MAEFERKIVEIDQKSKYHEFRYYTEVKKCSKGGYLKGQINVPENVQKIELFLLDKNQNEKHPNSLFVSPENRRGMELRKDMGNPKIQITVKETESDTKLELVIPDYWIAEDSLSSRFVGNVIQRMEFQCSH